MKPANGFRGIRRGYADCPGTKGCLIHVQLAKAHDPGQRAIQRWSNGSHRERLRNAISMAGLGLNRRLSNDWVVCTCAMIKQVLENVQALQSREVDPGRLDGFPEIGGRVSPLRTREPGPMFTPGSQRYPWFGTRCIHCGGRLDQVLRWSNREKSPTEGRVLSHCGHGGVVQRRSGDGPGMKGDWTVLSKSSIAIPWTFQFRRGPQK